MKLQINIKETFGQLIYLRTRDWLDFKTKEIKGQIITVGSAATFEKIEIRAKNQTKKMMSKYKVNQALNLDTIEANFWTMNGKSGLTFSMPKIKEN